MNRLSDNLEFEREYSSFLYRLSPTSIEVEESLPFFVSCLSNTSESNRYQFLSSEESINRKDSVVKDNKKKVYIIIHLVCAFLPMELIYEKPT